MVRSKGAAFQQLKQAMTSGPILALPDFSIPFVLETDAFGVGIGVILIQHDRAITFLSQALFLKHQGLSAYE